MTISNKYLFTLLSFLCIGMARAQNTPNGGTVPAPTQSIAPVPSGYSTGLKLNMVRTWSPTVPYTNELDVLSTSRTAAEVGRSTQYFDGLGRPLQAVSWQTAPSGKDVVAMNLYDVYGREAYKYLPYVQTAIGTNTNDGKFKLDPFADQATFMQAQFPGEQAYYGQIQLEASPLNRPLKEMAPGNSWAGSDRGITFNYQVNNSSEVRLWNIGTSSGSVPTSPGYYGTGELYRTISTDEHGKKTITYKDKEDHTVLKKVQLSNMVDIDGLDGWLCTYYIYDDFGLLRFVVPPVAMEKLAANGWDFSNTNLNNATDELCFQYAYDSKNRLIEKKVPGRGWVHMVYDQRSRLVMTQDAILRGNDQWLVTVYDDLNRPVKTYLWSHGDPREDQQSYADQEGNFPYPSSNSLSVGTLLTQTDYDNYSWITSGSYVTTGILTLYAGTSSSPDFITSYNTSPLYAQPLQPVTNVKGLVTRHQARVLGTGNFMLVANYYDDHGRVLQINTSDGNGSFDVSTNQYDFSGKLLVNYSYHKNAAATPDVQKLTTRYVYDNVGRLLELEKKVGAGSFKRVSKNVYTELGQLASKELGTNPSNPSTPLEILDNAYNIRGWLTSINKNYLDAAPNNTSRWFAMELAYDHGFSNVQYNGNIAGSIWKSRGSDKRRAYGFAYDAVNRLLKGDFTQDEGTAWDQSAGINYNVKMGTGNDDGSAYDANGNIKRMQQWGLKLSSSIQLDDLYYTYYGNSNRLRNVIDIHNDPQTKLGDFRTSANHPDATVKAGFSPTGISTDPNSITDYTYDANGNLGLDKNKDISSITYNHLNLPAVVTFTGKGSITYTYDADGTKLRKVTVDNTVSPAKTTTTDYMNGFVYENNELQYMPMEEGRIRQQKDASNNVTGHAFDYMIKDHLGNVRAILTEEEKMDTYQATFETANNTVENQLFLNYNNIIAKPACFNTTSERVQMIGAKTGTKGSPTVNAVVGVGKVMKVMAGDHINIAVRGMYNTGVVNNTNPSSLTPLEDVLMELFSTGITNINAMHGAGGASGFATTNSSLLSPGITDFLNTQGNYNSEGAYLNWVLLDEEQFKYMESGSGFESFFRQASAPEEGCSETVTLQANAGDGIDIKRNGYLYVYVSNTNTTYPVYFDDLHIEHTRGPLLEETHYYPFGLTMNGISSRAATNAPANKIKFGGKELQSNEFSDGSGLEQYDFGARNYDPQIGRWHTIDPLCEISRRWSIYNYAYNNPLRFIDPDGMKVVETEDRTTYTGEDAVSAFNDLKAMYGKKEANGNAIDEEPDNLDGGIDIKDNSIKTPAPADDRVPDDIISQLADGLTYSSLIWQLGELASNTEKIKQIALNFGITPAQAVERLKAFGDKLKTLGKNAYFIGTLLSVGTAIEKVRNGESPTKAFSKAGIDIAAGTASFLIGGPIGAAIAVGYLILDKTGVVDKVVDNTISLTQSIKNHWTGFVSWLNRAESALSSGHWW